MASSSRSAGFPTVTDAQQFEGRSIFDLPSNHLLFETHDAAADDGRIDTRSLAAHDFDVSVQTAFLPPEPPVMRLAGVASIWEDAWDASKGIVVRDTCERARRWRRAIEIMAVLHDLAMLKTVPLLRRAHVVLAFLMHRYLHSMPVPITPAEVPDSIAIPLAAVSRKLDLPPVLTYADTVLWNWRLRSPSVGFVIENLDIISSFTDTPSERHFFCVSALIEMRGAPAMRLMSSILDEAFLGDALSRTRITSHFLALAGHVDSCTAAVASMRTLCDPSTFFHTIRLWFHAGPRLLDGELYELGGPSAGQSSFVHALDVFLGISHSPAPDADSAEDTFMQRMLAYMPSAHRTFLLHLATEALPVRQLVVDEAERSPALTKAYDGVVEAVKRLRDEHMRLVQDYVLRFVRSERKLAADQDGDDTARGTGGSDVVELLKRTRQATLRARLDAPS